MLSRFLSKKLCARFFCSNVPQDTSPVMVEEVLQQLNVSDGQTVLDMTFGAGSHSEAILERINNVKIIALDRDLCAFEKAEALALKYPGQVKPLLGRFSELPSLLNPLGVQSNSLDAILFDLGCSTMQLNAPERGFSPDIDGPLDMRMDGARTSDSITAQDVLQKADEHDLTRIFRIYGGEKQSNKIARSIIKCRYSLYDLDSTTKLRDFLKGIPVDRSNRVVRNVFYALRTFVNNEFNELNYALLLAEMYLKKGGHMVSLSFTQLEDTIVKRHITGNVLENNPNAMPLKYYSQAYNLSVEEINDLQRSLWSPLTKHVLTANKLELSFNVRSKAAKLRSAIKL